MKLNIILILMAVVVQVNAQQLEIPSGVNIYSKSDLILGVPFQDEEVDTVDTVGIFGTLSINGYVGTNVTVTFRGIDYRQNVIQKWTLNLEITNGVAWFVLPYANWFIDYVLAKSPTTLQKMSWVERNMVREAVVNFTDYTALDLGDITGDNVVDDADYDLLYTFWGENTTDNPASIVADLNGDGVVNIFDYFQLASTWGWVGDYPNVTP